MKFISTVLLSLSASAAAQGLLETSKSFSTTAFCKNYQCTLETRAGTAWSYKTRFGDRVVINRESVDPGSKIRSFMIMVPDPSIDNYSVDNRTFADVQKQLMGTASVSLSRDCYYTTEDPISLAKVKYNKNTRTVSCANAGGIMVIAISVPGK